MHGLFATRTMELKRPFTAMMLNAQPLLLAGGEVEYAACYQWSDNLGSDTVLPVLLFEKGGCV